jgi:hypothetical protein
MSWLNWANFRMHQFLAQMQALMVAAPKWSDLGGGWKILVVYGLALFGGWLIVGACMCLMRRIVQNTKDKSFTFLDLCLGSAERGVAVTLILFAPGYLASFIGAWIALKFAAIGRSRRSIRRSLGMNDGIG